MVQPAGGARGVDLLDGEVVGPVDVAVLSVGEDQRDAGGLVVGVLAGGGPGGLCGSEPVAVVGVAGRAAGRWRGLGQVAGLVIGVAGALAVLSEAGALAELVVAVAACGAAGQLVGVVVAVAGLAVDFGWVVVVVVAVVVAASAR